MSTLAPLEGLRDDPYRQMVEFGPDLLVLVHPDGRCNQVSAASIPVLGRPAGTIVGMDLHDLVVDADRHILADLLAQLATGASAGAASFRVHGAYGIVIHVEATARRIPAGGGAVLAIRDITARKEEEALLIEANDLLRRRATEDPITCLPNRGHFMAALEREVRRSRRAETPLAVLVVGVDDMHLFNDFYGRDAGDLALREVASAIAGALSRPGDVAGRLKGAMLGILLPDTELAGAAAIADRVRQVVDALGLEHAGVAGGRMTVTLGLACAGLRSGADALVQEAICELEITRAASLSCVSSG